MNGEPKRNRAEQVRERAEGLWRQAGSPPGGPEDYEGRAEELIAIEEAGKQGTVPVRHGDGDPDVEPLEALENQGEFPTLTDQGEDNTAPLRLGDRKKALE